MEVVSKKVELIFVFQGIDTDELHTLCAGTRTAILAQIILSDSDQ